MLGTVKSVYTLSRIAQYIKLALLYLKRQENPISNVTQEKLEFTLAGWQCHDQQNEFDLFNSRCISKIFILQVGKVKATMRKTFASQKLKRRERYATIKAQHATVSQNHWHWINQYLTCLQRE